MSLESLRGADFWAVAKWPQPSASFLLTLCVQKGCFALGDAQQTTNAQRINELIAAFPISQRCGVRWPCFGVR